MTTEQEQYKKERGEAYDRILALTQKNIDAIAPSFITDLSVLSLTGTQRAAERDSWTLFRKGIQHLKDGGAGGQPGLFSTALTKASLRSSLTANTFAVKAPEFQENYYDFDHASGGLEALFFCRRLLEAAMADADKSGKMIQRKVGTATVPLLQPEHTPEDKMLAGFFAAVRKNGAAGQVFDAAKTPEIEDLEAAVRKQAMLTAKVQVESYRTVAQKLDAEMTALFTQPDIPSPAPPAGPRL